MPGQIFPPAELSDLRLGINISSGTELGFSHINVFGANDDVDTSSAPEDIWDSGGLYEFPASAQSIEAVSSSANDIDVTGSGARTIRVQGLDTNYNPQEEDIAMNGMAAVALVNTYMRIHKAFILSAGSVGTNDGIITIRIPIGPNQAQILAGNGESLMAIFTIPNGKTGFLKRWYCSISKTQSGTTDIRILTSLPTFAPYNNTWRVHRIITCNSIGSSTWNEEVTTPGLLVAKTDIRLVANNVSANNIRVVGGFDLILVDD